MPHSVSYIDVDDVWAQALHLCQLLKLLCHKYSNNYSVIIVINTIYVLLTFDE